MWDWWGVWESGTGACRGVGRARAAGCSCNSRGRWAGGAAGPGALCLRSCEGAAGQEQAQSETVQPPLNLKVAC